MCDHCGVQISPRALLPIAGYFLSGRCCLACRQPIPAFYPIVETAAGLIGVLPFLFFDPLPALGLAILGWWLLLLSSIDHLHYVLPDSLTLPLIAAGLLAPLVGQGVSVMPTDSVLGAVLGYGALWSVRAIYFRLRGIEGLGLGDAKLLAAAGAWCGWQSLPAIVTLAACCGLLSAFLAKKSSLQPDTAIAFGPPLAAAFWAQILLLSQW